MALPPGWTDDMNIALPGHRSLEEVVTFVILRCMEGTDYDRVHLSLIEEIGLSPDNAALAWDRVHGGIVRASTRRLENCPDRARDPLAWLSFERAMEDPSIIAVLYPHFPVTEPPVKNRPERAVSAGAKPWWRIW
jgi:hypothetical protein